MLLLFDLELMTRCALAPWVETLLRYLDGEQSHLDLPVDAPATPLEARVWQGVRDIPYGTMRTYCEVARSRETPTTAQAVGQACGTPAS